MTEKILDTWLREIPNIKLGYFPTQEKYEEAVTHLDKLADKLREIAKGGEHENNSR